MRWSWKCFQFRGIGVYLHATFLILIAFIGLSHWTAGHSPEKTIEGVAFILAPFTCVVLHHHGDGKSVPISREAWGVSMSDQTIRTARCPGGSEQRNRLLRSIETGRVDPLALTTHRFPFKDIRQGF